MRTRSFAAFFLPWALGFLLCCIAPLLYGAGLSLFDIFSGRFVGLLNYSEVLQNPVFRRALLNTVVFVVLSVGSLIASSFFLSCLLARKAGQSRIAQLMALPMAVPAVSISYVWYWTFHYRGYLNSLLSNVFGHLYLNWFSGPLMYLPMVLLFLWKNAGFAVLIYLSGIRGIPKEYEEVLRLDNGGAWARVRYIYWPCLYPQTFFVVIIGLLRSMNIFTEIYAVWSDYPPLPLYLLQHYIYHNYLNMEYGRSVAAAVFLSVLVILFTLALRSAEKRYSDA
jgi:multiple sugar transport system permease protein